MYLLAYCVDAAVLIRFFAIATVMPYYLYHYVVIIIMTLQSNHTIFSREMKEDSI